MALSTTQKAQIALLRSRITDEEWQQMPSSDDFAISIIAKYTPQLISIIQNRIQRNTASVAQLNQAIATDTADLATLQTS